MPPNKQNQTPLDQTDIKTIDGKIRERYKGYQRINKLTWNRYIYIIGNINRHDLTGMKTTEPQILFVEYKHPIITNVHHLHVNRLCFPVTTYIQNNLLPPLEKSYTKSNEY
jgi:hypothetical protein